MKHEMSLMNDQGDTKVYWDPTDSMSVAVAQDTYAAHIERRFRAFSMDPNGTMGEIMTEFDPNARSILFVPPLAGG